jgi:uncharacterized protein
MKYLLLVLAVVLLLWMLFGRNRTRRPPGDGNAPRAPGGPVEMSRCARCGVHLPRSEALLAGGQVYCSAEHRDAGPRADGR